MASFNHVTSIYPILRTLASFVSTLDLFNLALTCKSNYQQIRASEKTFNALRRHCLCDGHGLAERQAFTGLYSLDNRSYVWGGDRYVTPFLPSSSTTSISSIPCHVHFFRNFNSTPLFPIYLLSPNPHPHQPPPEKSGKTNLSKSVSTPRLAPPKPCLAKNAR
jgi:hypothetical protein